MFFINKKSFKVSFCNNFILFINQYQYKIHANLFKAHKKIHQQSKLNKKLSNDKYIENF